MIIRNGCLFIHIPKTGGTSIRRVMARAGACYVAHIANPETSIRRKQNWPNPHRLLSTYAPLFGRDTLSQLWTFTVVRNPWACLASGYGKAMDHHRRRGDHSSSRMSFADYVRWRIDECVYMQSRYLRDADYDLIATTETLTDDWPVIAEHLDVPAEPLPRENRRRRRPHYHRLYDRELRELVAEAEWPVIEMFGYEFEEGRA